MTDTVRVAAGDTVDLTLPWSEVCIHLRVAGKTRRVQITETSAQIIDQSGRPFSTPITHGEAGIRDDAHGLYVERSALPLYRKETPS